MRMPWRRVPDPPPPWSRRDKDGRLLAVYTRDGKALPASLTLHMAREIVEHTGRNDVEVGLAMALEGALCALIEEGGGGAAG